MVSLFSSPDVETLKNSYNVMCLCHHTPNTNLAIIPVTSIVAIIAALPYSPLPEWQDWWYILEELGFDIAQFDDINIEPAGERGLPE